METARTKLHFSRFEFKYVLPKNLRDEVEAELQHFLDLDPFVATRPEHKYLVRSLYFDDAGFTAFHDKTDGLHTRSKFRVRTYTDDPAAEVPWFLEIKGRYNNLVFKHRVPICADGLDPTAADDRFSEQIVSHGQAGSVLTQYQFELYRRLIRPQVLIDYHRRPYVSKYDPEFRLTFDEGLNASLTGSLFPDSSVRTRRLLPGYTVLEVKFRYHVPSWFHRVIQAFELRRRSLSKICEGTEALGLAEDPA